jgi:predicted O-methyltransferase YrrM
MSADLHLQAMRAQAVANRIPVISPQNALFLSQLLVQQRPVRMLEIGSAIGLSSAIIAHSLAQWGGALTTVEISVPTQASAQANLQALGLRNVRSLCGDARLLLRQWAAASEAPFDCIFIDAHKSQTHVFYEASLAMLAAGGMVIVDDVWRFRQKMPQFYDALATKKQAYRLHFVDGTDATMVITPQTAEA